MTGSNHVMTGALIAVSVQRPLLAIPTAFLSHFVLDVLPHFGYGDVPINERDSQKHFLAIQITDAIVSLGLFLLMPWLLASAQSPLITSLCMLAAQAPDVFWIFEYTYAQRNAGKYQQRNWYLRFHKAIQWCERHWGAYVEVVYFGLLVTLITIIVR